MKVIKKIIEKVFTKEIILYALFGGFTTIVNLGSFYLMYNILNWEKNIANALAILLAVLFAYITNKDLVFHSKAKNLKEKLTEFYKFMLGRAFTMLLEYFGCLLLFQTTIPEMVTKCLMTIIVIILNFFISKFFAFRTNKKEGKKDEKN